MQIINTISRKKRIVSLTPLIDVVFILLVFFMLVSNFNQYNAIEVNAPAPSLKPVNKMDGSILIRISKTGAIDIAGKPVKLENVATKIKNALAQDQNKLVIIKPHNSLPIQQTVDLLDNLAKAGITNFSLMD